MNKSLTIIINNYSLRIRLDVCTSKRQILFLLRKKAIITPETDGA